MKLESSDESSYYSYMRSCFKTGKLQIDLSGAINWINCYERQLIEKVNASITSGEEKQEEIKEIVETIEGFKLLAKYINQKEYHVSVDSTSFRMHSILTNMKSELRNYVDYGGEKMVAVDIKNSQPFMMLRVLQPSFWELPKYGNITLAGMNERLYKWLKEWEEPEEDVLGEYCISREDYHYKYRHKFECDDIIRILESSQSLFQTDLSVNEFKSLVVNGQLYEFIQNEFEGMNFTNNGVNRFSSRTMVKKEALQWMYFDSSRYASPYHAPYRKFKRKFPTICRVMELLKTQDYRDFSILLQRIESDLVLGRICRYITESKPQMPLFSIHDSIVTTVGNEEYLKDVMEHELQKWIGYKPMLKLEYWNPENAYKESNFLYHCQHNKMEKENEGKNGANVMAQKKDIEE